MQMQMQIAHSSGQLFIPKALKGESCGKTFERKTNIWSMYKLSIKLGKTGNRYFLCILSYFSVYANIYNKVIKMR